MVEKFVDSTESLHFWSLLATLWLAPKLHYTTASKKYTTPQHRQICIDAETCFQTDSNKNYTVPSRIYQI